jgi:hypothetical protein
MERPAHARNNRGTPKELKRWTKRDFEKVFAYIGVA